ncbi:MAG: BatA domain-containing protein, partial [Candidatus Aminicenantes bacterium]|nr:BatA domain-containing protein [Candidatus Aminicenantes bacterium]
MFQFQNKIYLLCLLVVPVLVYWHLFLQKKGKRFIFFSSKSLLMDSSQSLKAFLVKNLYFLKIISLSLFIFALARPQI